MGVRSVIAVLVLIASACGGTVVERRPVPPPRVEVEVATTVVANPGSVGVTESEPVTLVLSYAEVGGCDWAGPNCPTYQLWSDGTIEVLRSSLDGSGGTPEDSAVIEAALATKIQRLARELPADFLDTLPEGSCQACVDGIDVAIVVHLGTDERFSISSVAHTVPWNDPLFATISVVREQMGDVLELPFVSR